jgi:hypothetical protein
MTVPDDTAGTDGAGGGEAGVRPGTPDPPRPSAPGPLDDATAERLLSGAPDVAGHDLLAAVLSLTTAPPRPTELAGEHAALTAYRTARTTPDVRTARAGAVASPVDGPTGAGGAASAPVDGMRARFRRAGGSRVLTAKISAVAALAVLGGSGLTLAASTGHLPGQRPAPAPASELPAGPPHGSPASTGPSPSGPGLSGAPGMSPAAGPDGGAAPPRGHATTGAPAGQPAQRPSASATPSHRPSWFPSAWPSWLPQPSPTQPAGRASPTPKPGH